MPPPPPQTCGCALRFVLLLTYVRPYVHSEILCADLLLQPLMDFVHSIHGDQHDMEMTVNTGFCDAASFT